MFTKFYEILLLPFKDIEKPKRREWTDGGTAGMCGGGWWVGVYNSGLQIVVK